MSWNGYFPNENDGKGMINMLQRRETQNQRMKYVNKYTCTSVVMLLYAKNRYTQNLFLTKSSAICNFGHKIQEHGTDT
jgi:hypothetical protein